MGLRTLTRRECLSRIALASAATATPLLCSAVACDGRSAPPDHALKPTSRDVVGPFYRRGAPATAALRRPDDAGLPLDVSGHVLDVGGEPLPGAQLEIWQADHFGHYDLNGYRFRSAITTDREGEYAFATVMPGHYPDRAHQHIHYIVRAPGHRPLVTQLYFATDSAFGGDLDEYFAREPNDAFRSLVRPVALTVEAGKDISARVRFEIVLERA